MRSEKDGIGLLAKLEYIDETSRKFGIIAEAFLRGVWMDNVVA